MRDEHNRPVSGEKRLTDDPDVPAELRAVIDSARRATPDAETAARIAGRLALSGAPPSSGSGALPWRGVVVGLAVIAFFGWLGVGLYGLGAPRSPSSPRSEATPILPPEAATVEPPTPMPVATTEPERRADPAASELPSAIEPRDVAPPPRAARRPRSEPHLRAGEPVVQPSEAELLGGAHSRLAGDPAGALQLLGEHERAYPHGAMAQEREVLAIDALGRLGRTREARARAAHFIDEFPTSALRGRVDSLVGRE